jgi:transcriptional regulator with XRE-family HTH domain
LRFCRKFLPQLSFNKFFTVYNRFLKRYTLQKVFVKGGVRIKMSNDCFSTQEFSRIITLLRKERGITQKKASEELMVSQALLSHYEKGVRECGLGFVARAADYYGVSCDYLLGRSASRSGLTLNVDDIPAPESTKNTDGHFRGSVLPTLNRKLISNSLNILYDKLSSNPNKALVSETSAYLMLAVYKMFRLLYSSSSKNSQSIFRVPQGVFSGYSSAAMCKTEANVASVLNGEILNNNEALKDTSSFTMTTESLTEDYPLYATSLLNVIKNCEERIVPQKNSG